MIHTYKELSQFDARNSKKIGFNKGSIIFINVFLLLGAVPFSMLFHFIFES
jgi:hypothetical protein